MVQRYNFYLKVISFVHYIRIVLTPPVHGRIELRLNISISQNGVTIESDNTSVVSGQVVVYDLSTYAVGEYTLSVETGGDVITEFSITVEEE